jgi:fermentation-respiration switch protein FrsA (DUF1100 family)
MVALVVLLLLAALLLGASGWYYAGQIDAQALAVAPPSATPQRNVTVTAAANGHVTLRGTVDADAHALDTSDVYGLVWSGGSGVLTGIPERSADGVSTRALQVVSGTAPSPGTPASTSRDVWTDPTDAAGVPFQGVRYACAGGSCAAWYVPGRSSTWMIMVHGKGATREEPLRAMVPAVRAGLPVLDISYRNDSGAPRDPSGRYGYGTTEWLDLDHAVRWASDHGAQHVVLFGSSMGGSIVASFLEHSRMAGWVRGVVLDAPALSLRAAVDLGAQDRSLPLGLPIPRVLTSTAEWMAGWRFGVNWSATDHLPGSWLHVPALVFHGTADRTVPVDTSDALRAAHPHLVEEVRVPGADHVESWNASPATYEAREGTFLGCLTTAAPTCTG